MATAIIVNDNSDTENNKINTATKGKHNDHSINTANCSYRWYKNSIILWSHDKGNEAFQFDLSHNVLKSSILSKMVAQRSLSLIAIEMFFSAWTLTTRRRCRSLWCVRCICAHFWAETSRGETDLFLTLSLIVDAVKTSQMSSKLGGPWRVDFDANWGREIGLLPTPFAAVRARARRTTMNAWQWNSPRINARTSHLGCRHNCGHICAEKVE